MIGAHPIEILERPNGILQEPIQSWSFKYEYNLVASRFKNDSRETSLLTLTWTSLKINGVYPNEIELLYLNTDVNHSDIQMLPLYFISVLNEEQNEW
jgi:hypothetical protein